MKRSTILDTYLDSSDKSWKKFDRALNHEGNNGARNKISNTFLPDRHYKFDANKIYETRGTILDTYLDNSDRFWKKFNRQLFEHFITHQFL